MSNAERLWALRRQAEQLAALALALRLEAMARDAWRKTIAEAAYEMAIAASGPEARR